MDKKTFNIEDIESPAFLKTLTITQLNSLCADIRSFIIENVSKTGGHLSSNLGSVESIVAMHYCFDSPKDKFLFDVSHQAYTHKILTGRSKEFINLRKQNGLSGFINYDESVHDVWESGHSSTTLAAAAGFIEAKEYNKDIGEVIAFIGDGSIQNGVAFEGLNYIGSQKDQKVIIVLNDNNMSISKNVGRLARRFSKIRTRRSYKVFKKLVPGFLKKHLIRLQNGMRSFVYGKNIFSSLGYKYYGPIDGHDIKELIRYFNFAKTCSDSLILHIVTKKGYGYQPAMEDTSGKWHGVGKFDVETGKIINNHIDGYISWSKGISNIIKDKFENTNNLRLICPATLSGSNFESLLDKFGNNIIDVGINEELACVMASSMSRNGLIPIISIYSTFLQRSYDYVNNDICRSNNHVIFLIDRSGIIGGDGSTHQGIFDISFLTPLPNMIIAMPKDLSEANALIDLAINSNSPFAIRYPKEDVKNNEITNTNLKIGKWIIEKDISDINIITYGSNVNKAFDLLKDKNIGLINALFIKPIDVDLLNKLNNKKVIVYEESIKNGSLYSLICEKILEHKLNIDIQFVGIDDQYITGLGTSDEIKKELSIDLESLIKNL